SALTPIYPISLLQSPKIRVFQKRVERHEQLFSPLDYVPDYERPSVGVARLALPLPMPHPATPPGPSHQTGQGGPRALQVAPTPSPQPRASSAPPRAARICAPRSSGPPDTGGTASLP